MNRLQQKCRRIAGDFDCHADGDFDCHADAAVQCEAHRPMEHIPGFTRSHWMPPSVECSWLECGNASASRSYANGVASSPSIWRIALSPPTS